jgi:glycosyltransferase involved in cell wall biosynthesis
MKKTILHIIYSLGRGGAETMLVTVVKELNEYNNIIVTLSEDNHFEGELKCDKYICLNTASFLMAPVAAIKLRKIISKYKPDLVHSHLFWPTIVARMATPKKIPLITTIHAFIATSMEYKSTYIKWIDKISYRFRKSIIIGVAKGALSEYFSFLKLKPYKTYLLYTFVDTRVFNNDAVPRNNDIGFKLITVGALREQKNHQYLINAFKQLRADNFELHIYGEGPLEGKLKKLIAKNNITNVILKGEVKNINLLIPQYNLFVMSSTFEGFSLAVLEAMALQMPVLLSDINSFREQCEDTAEYFSLTDENQFVAKLKNLSSGEFKLQELGSAAKHRVLTNFTLEHHMKGLRNIYLKTLKQITFT